MPSMGSTLRTFPLTALFVSGSRCLPYHKKLLYIEGLRVVSLGSLGILARGVTKGDCHLQVVTLGEVQTLQVGLCSLRVHNGNDATQAARADTHAPCREHHILCQESRVELSAIALVGHSDKCHGGGVAEEVAETWLLTHLWHHLLCDSSYAIKELLVVNNTHSPRLATMSVSASLAVLRQHYLAKR